jgi:hypothetical protein
MVSVLVLPFFRENTKGMGENYTGTLYFPNMVPLSPGRGARGEETQVTCGTYKLCNILVPSPVRLTAATLSRRERGILLENGILTNFYARRGSRSVWNLSTDTYAVYR